MDLTAHNVFYKNSATFTFAIKFANQRLGLVVYNLLSFINQSIGYQMVKSTPHKLILRRFESPTVPT